MASLLHLTVNDPDRLNLRKALRAALVVPATYVVVAEVFDQPGVGLFAFFAGIVGLVFADFGGPPPTRSAAYAAMIVLGDIVIAAGSVLSFNVAASATGMFAVMFGATFATIYGRYTPAFVSVVGLAYSLSVLYPVSELGTGERLLGWTIGGLAALVAALVLWPVDRRLGLRECLGRVASLLSDTVAVLERRELAAARLERAVAELAVARARAAAPLRPAGPAVRDVGLLHLVENLEHAADLAADAIGERATADDMALAAEISDTLARAAITLTGRSDGHALADAMTPLDHARLVRLVRLRSEAISEQGHPVDTVDVVRSSFPLLALSHVALWIEANAAEATGSAAGVHPTPSAPELAGLPDRLRDTVERAWNIARVELDPGGVAFRNSMRGAAAMTVAVAVAQLVPVEHAFWITLGTLSVLRSSASSTSASALQAVGGTAVGFVVAALALLVFGGSEVAMWTLLPITVGLAGYTPGAVSFVVGQASFTTCVVVLFDLAEPGGLRTDIVRVETVTLGAIVAVLTGLLLWPRGAHATLATALAAVYRAAAKGIGVILTGTATERTAAALELRRERRHADSAFAAALGERGERVDAAAWIRVFCVPNLVRALLSGLVRDVERPGPQGCTAAVAITLDRRAARARQLEAVAERLEASSRGGPVPAASMAGDDAGVDSDSGLKADPDPETGTEPDTDPGPDLRRCVEASASDESRFDDALLLLAWNEWLARLEEDLRQAAPAVDAVTRASAPHAWLRWSRRPR